MAKKPHPTRAEERELIARAQGGCIRSRNELITRNMGFIRQQSIRHAKRRVAGEDRVQLGVIGMIKAIERFDLTRELRLTTYASWWIRHEIMRFSQNDDMVRRPVYQHGRVPLEGHWKVASEMARLGCLSLDKQLRDDTGHTLHDVVASDEPNALEQVELEQAEARVRESIATLPERLQTVIAGRFRDDLTLAEIGHELGRSRERIRQLQVEAFELIRDFMDTAS